ncbi:uncharacterized protein [Palaemon carinicauda]|uniref:uncharacterized protein n=1 Tax=Palaemon carinicauda TaxID=392227 RepID=UPI0035B66C33
MVVLLTLKKVSPRHSTHIRLVLDSEYDAYSGSALAVDDCGLAGFRILCQNDSDALLPHLQRIVSCDSAVWKDQVECNTGDFIDGIQIFMADDVSGSDRTALESTRMHCHNSNIWIKSNTKDRIGKWSLPVMCPLGMRLCGMRLKVEGATRQ